MNRWAKIPGMRKSTKPAVPGAHQEVHDSDEAAKMNSLRAGVLGANDGIVSVAALLIGVIATGAGDKAILMAGLAATIAGAVSMALGEYVSVSAQRDSEQTLIAKEQKELREAPEEELQELAGILSGYGISKDTAVEAAREIHAEDALRAHLQLELGIDANELTSAWAAAFFSALSFLAGAALPMISVFVAPTGTQAWVVTAVTMLSLALTGLISAKIAGTSVARSVVRLVVGGGLGLALTYGAGALFGGVA
ncbi:VIT family protein [Corynebacterium urealyticum]|nr:VIT family protein [Corynebacterium urealyticum]